MTNHLSRVLVLLCLILGVSFAHAAQEEKEWNFLVYLNGVNSLDSFGPMNINQMEQVGSTDKMNILVQWGSSSNPNTQRLLVQKDNDTTKVTSPVVQDMGPGVDMGDWHSVVNFVQWAHDNYPAKKYFIVVWDHGNGWHFTNSVALQAARDVHPSDISWDDRTGHYIKTEELAQALAESAKIIGHKVDVYGSDACLMGMIEVASQMSSSVDYFVGSQETEPGAGWPYAPFLTKWTTQIDTLTPAQVAVLLSQEYKAAYSGGVYGNNSVTMAAYDLSKTSLYESAFKAVATKLSTLSAANMKKANAAGDAAKSFADYDYKDAIDFLDKLEAQGIKDASFAGVRNAQKQFVLSNDQNTDSVTWGVSIWVPAKSDYSEYGARYDGLNFAKNSGWGAFLKKLVK
jgi:hypothetical protein